MLTNGIVVFIPPRGRQALLAYLAQLLLHGQSGVRHEIIYAQNYRAWQQTLRTVYPAVPRATPAPLPKTPHPESAANDEAPTS